MSASVPPDRLGGTPRVDLYAIVYVDKGRELGTVGLPATELAPGLFLMPTLKTTAEADAALCELQALYPHLTGFQIRRFRVVRRVVGEEDEERKPGANDGSPTAAR
jgi:hypothetical protein